MTHEKQIKNLIIKTFDKKIKPNYQFINENNPNFNFFLKKNKLSKDRLTQEFGPMDLIQSNIIYDLKRYRKNSKLNLVRLSKKSSQEKVHRNLKGFFLFEMLNFDAQNIL